MFVATVIAPKCPACAMIAPSRSLFFAFSISCFNPASESRRESSSFFSIETVPISMGWPFACRSFTSLINASYFASFVL